MEENVKEDVHRKITGLCVFCLRRFDPRETSSDDVIAKCHGAGRPALFEAAVAQNNL